jgi:quercetin dioxygenase-like cupin family protein
VPFYLHIGILVGILGLVAGIATMFVGTVLATPGLNFGLAGLGSATLDRFHLRQPGFTIRSQDATDVVMGELTIDVGGHTGWHTHPGPTFVTVAQGDVEVSILTKKGCTTQRFGPGEGFAEAGNEVHIARNVGTERVVAFVTFLAVPTPDGEILDPTPPDPGCDQSSRG